MQGALPADVTGTLVVDRGLASVELLDLCDRLGWPSVMRLSADATQGVHVRLPNGIICPAGAATGTARSRRSKPPVGVPPS